MELKRTANAGILLKLDGVTILLDGVCREVKPYPATPPETRSLLMEQWPDIVAFTHMHKDHYDPAYAAAYTGQTGRVLLGPGQIKGSMEQVRVRDVTVTPISSRHIGAAGRTVEHASFLVQGSKCLWFMGDSAPTQWRGRDLPKPDVMVVPYAYANTAQSWHLTQSFAPKKVILLHMPEAEQDGPELWDAVRKTVDGSSLLTVPMMGQTLEL